ncbi:MAG TPA: hypothetical protein VII49_11340 [Rhizomicrobium sp.]
MKRLDRLLFPRGHLLNFLLITILSGAIALILAGRQIYQANWGVIDDSEIFGFLGRGLRLPLTDVWHTLLTKTEVGSLQGRFRPTYYTLRLIETSLWGPNVHLWYLAHTACFAVFLSSIWWFMRRFVGGWLSGVLTAYISLLPLWSDVWSRLGPSETYGALFVGIMVFASYFILFSQTRPTRNTNAILLTLATIALVGLKETFIPLAGGAACVLLFAGIRKNLSPLLIGILGLMILTALGGIVFVVARQVGASGTDVYASPIGPWPVLKFFGKGLYYAIGRTWWLYVIPILFFEILNVIPRKSLKSWIADSAVAFSVYGFLVVSYATQSALYRFGFPVNARYDFPAMLLVPLTGCIIACEVSRKIRAHLPERTVDYAQLAAAAFVFFGFGVGSGYLDHTKPLSVAVKANIEKTNSFYSELQRAVGAAKKSPQSPVILEAYGPGAFESVYSLLTYLSAFGATNRVSIRLHPDSMSYGKFYDDLEHALSEMQDTGAPGFTPLRDGLADLSHGCISIGINGLPDAGCSGFRVRAP